MPLSLPSEIAVDLRQPVVGDSFNWEAIEPGAAKKSIVIHATASQSPTEDGFTIADYHVNHNGWGGSGVHFCVTKDVYPGRPNFTSPGAQVQYLGDLLTWRAGTLNQNPGRIHIEISGLFTPGNSVPSANQLRATRALIDHLLTATPELPSLNYFSQVTYHNAVPGQNTECPGWQNPQFNDWFTYLQGGAFPDHLYAPVTPPATPVVVPVPPVVVPADPGKGSGTPEYEATYRTTQENRAIQRDGAVAVDATTGSKVSDIPNGQTISIAGYFTSQGTHYARTVWAAANNKWNGIDVTYFDVPSTGQNSGPVAVTVTPPLTQEQQRADFLGLPADQKISLFDRIVEALAHWLATLVSKRNS